MTTLRPLNARDLVAGHVLVDSPPDSGGPSARYTTGRVAEVSDHPGTGLVYVWLRVPRRPVGEVYGRGADLILSHGDLAWVELGWMLHDDCEDCRSLLLSAETHTRVTGSVGASCAAEHRDRDGLVVVDHAARWARR